MVDSGLARRTSGRPPRFSAAAPDVAVTALVQERERRLNEARSLVHQLMDTYREAVRNKHPDMAVELLTNRDDISAAVQRMTLAAQREVRAFDRPPYVDRAGSGLSAQVERSRRGVVHRVVYDQAAMAGPGRLQSDILPSIRAGEQARVRIELPMKLVIRDREEAIIPFHLGSGAQTAAYLIHACPMLIALETMFESEWERALPLSDIGESDAGTGGIADAALKEMPAGEPDAATRSLLVLLASGLSDAAMARTLGWSDRTTQRRLQRLLSDLGAVTRFQACYAAVRRGWL
jgi:AraC-like DNA-binding protein